MSTQLQVFGDDFDTPEGTCIRDYGHVADLCAAHLLAMKRARERLARNDYRRAGVGSTSMRIPTAFMMSMKLFNSGFPRGESVR